MITFETILSELNEKLTVDQIQLIKDTINKGGWGDCTMEFEENGKVITTYCYIYCTNDAKNAGHFTGRKVSAMFRFIYKRLGIAQNNGWGQNDVFGHVTDWWGDGSGDVFYIRAYEDDTLTGVCLYEQFEEWARS